MELRPILSSQFQQFRNESIDRFIDSFSSLSDSEKQAKREKTEAYLDKLFAQGAATSDQFIYNVYANDQHIGYVWFGAGLDVEPDCAWGWEIYIFTEHQDKGYGSQIFSEFQDHVREKGFKHLAFMVNKENTRALHVYKKQGFEIIEELPVQYRMQRSL